MAMVPMMMVISARAGSVAVHQMVGAAWRPLVAAVLMALAIHALRLPSEWPAVLVLGLKVALGAGLYPACLMALWLLVGRPTGFEASTLAQIRTLLAR